MKTQYKAGLAFVLLVGGSAVLWAQTKTDDSGSLAALTAEVRLLRVAVEDASRAQTQTQALSVALAAQQSRMQQLSTRIDASRTELAAAELHVKQSAFFIQGAQESMASSDPEERAQATDMMKMWKQGAEEAAAALDSARRRESELTTAMRLEEQRWQDLINRLEAAIRK